MLDLVVLSGYKHQLSRLIVSADVPGLVDDFRIGSVQRVLDKGFTCADGIIVISQGQGSSPDADLSLLPLRRRLSLLRKEQYFPIGEGMSHRNSLPVLKLPLHPVIAAHACTLGRAVKIRERGLRQGLPPEPELLYGKHLASESYRMQVFRLYKLKGSERADHGKGGDHPADRIDLVLVEILHQCRGDGKEIPWNQVCRGPEFQGGIQLLQTGVKI